eukprot:5341946-Pyramimonas_sp.AAC.1
MLGGGVYLTPYGTQEERTGAMQRISDWINDEGAEAGNKDLEVIAWDKQLDFNDIDEVAGRHGRRWVAMYYLTAANTHFLPLDSYY